MEKYDELIKRLTENKENLIAVTGGKAEKSLKLDSINAENVIDLRGEISLLEFAALLSKSDIVISNDSAPIHIGSVNLKSLLS